MLIKILKLGLFCISMLGSFELIRKIAGDKINIYYLPGLTIAIQTTILFFAGITNLLPEAVYFLYGLGFLGLIFSLWKTKGISFLKEYMNAGYLVLLIWVAIAVVFLQGKLFAHYDSFTHWATVVKNMLMTDRFPNHEDALIMFQEYPLGSSSYIYFFAKLINSSESIQMLAQTYMMLAAMLPLFSFAKKNRIAAAAVITAFINFVFQYNVSVTELLVDTLLPLVGISGFIFALTHCGDASKLSLWCASFYMVQLIQIKNSGVFFVLLIAAVVLHDAWKKNVRVTGILSALLPWGTFILWHQHCGAVFESAATSMHAMTLTNYKSVFGAKTAEDIRAITAALFKFAFTYKEFWIVVGITLVIGGLILLFKKENLRKQFRHLVSFSAVLYGIYLLGLLGVYLFSMPKEEVILCRVERYTNTILIAILYLDMIAALKLMEEIHSEKRAVLFAALGFISMFFGCMLISSGTVHFITPAATELEKHEQRAWLEKVKRKYDIPLYDSYCMLVPALDDYYAYYMQKYVFQSVNASIRVVDNPEVLDSVPGFRYLLVYDRENQIIQDWIREKYPEQYGNEVIIQQTY